MAVQPGYDEMAAEPASVPGILAHWVERLQAGAPVLVAFQCSDDVGIPWREFDHQVTVPEPLVGKGIPDPSLPVHSG